MSSREVVIKVLRLALLIFLIDVLLSIAIKGNIFLQSSVELALFWTAIDIVMLTIASFIDSKLNKMFFMLAFIQGILMGTLVYYLSMESFVKQLEQLQGMFVTAVAIIYIAKTSMKEC